MDLEIMDPKEEARQELEIALANIREGKHAFLYEGMPNHGPTCEENMQDYEDALPVTARLVQAALLESKAQASG